jgi:hypothetical protein
MSTTITSLKALVTLCDGEDDYFEQLFEITDGTEESAKALAREIAGDDLKRRLHCAWVQIAVPGGVASWHFDRDELREGSDA